MLTRRFILGAGITCAVLGGARTADAASEAAIMAKRKIHYLKRERMLVEEIVARVCLAHLDVDRAHQIARIEADRKKTHDVLDAVLHGDRALGLSRETSGQVRQALRGAKAAWLRFDARVSAFVESGGTDASMMLTLATSDAPVLDAFEDAVIAVERAHAGADVPLHLLIATRLATQQEVLAERMVKHACMVVAGAEVERSRALIAEEVAIFEHRITALSQGFPMLGIRAPENPALRAQWRAVAESWSGLKPEIAAIAAGEMPSLEAVGALVDRFDPLIALIEKAVVLYEREV